MSVRGSSKAGSAKNVLESGPCSQALGSAGELRPANGDAGGPVKPVAMLDPSRRRSMQLSLRKLVRPTVQRTVARCSAKLGRDHSFEVYEARAGGLQRPSQSTERSLQTGANYSPRRSLAGEFVRLLSVQIKPAHAGESGMTHRERSWKVRESTEHYKRNWQKTPSFSAFLPLPTEDL